MAQVPAQAQAELAVHVHEGPPGAVFAGVEPVRFRRHPPILLFWLMPQPKEHMVEASTYRLQQEEP